MVLETTPVEALVIEATNQLRRPLRRRASQAPGQPLGGIVSWRNVPNSLIVADAVVAALLDGVLPERTVRRCIDPTKFVNITRRDSSKVGVLINDATGAETPCPA